MSFEPIIVPMDVSTDAVSVPLGASADDASVPMGVDDNIRPLPNITIGEVEAGEEAEATMTGTLTDPVLNLVLPRGERGPKGETGTKGDKGDTGNTGPKGDTGEQGERGPQGPKGDTGPAGPTGPKGDTGEQGEQGPKGDTGPTGPKGDTGEQGPKGDTGERGPTGPQGDPTTVNGKTGASITLDAADVGALPAGTLYAGAAEAGGAADRTASIPFGQVDSTSTATVFTATVPGITELRDGVCCYLMNGVVTSASGFTLNINNLGAKPVYQTLAAASRSTTIFNVAYTMLFVYNSSRVSGGCWDVYYGYNSNDNTIAYNVRVNNAPGNITTGATLYRYEVLFTKRDGTLLPANNVSNKATTYTKALTTDSFDPFQPIYYYSTTTSVAAGSAPSAAYMYMQHASMDLRYAFNAGATLTAYQPVYIRCVPQGDLLVTLDGNDCITQSVPTTDDGLVYIYLGRANTTSAIWLSGVHPVYECKNGKLQMWGNADAPAQSSTAQCGAYLSMMYAFAIQNLLSMVDASLGTFLAFYIPVAESTDPDSVYVMVQAYREDVAQARADGKVPVFGATNSVVNGDNPMTVHLTHMDAENNKIYEVVFAVNQDKIIIRAIGHEAQLVNL